jgi:hypothetical protein
MLWYQLADQWSFLGNTWSNVDNLIQDPGGDIFVRLSGTGRFYGHASNVVNYSYSEGSTPLVPGDESGAIGDVNIEVLDISDIGILLYKDEFYLQDNFHGSVIGNIENVSGNNDNISMGGRSILSLLNVEKVIPPRRNTIGNIIAGVLSDVGVTSNIILDDKLSTDIINVPGFEGDLWVYTKQLCAAHEVEVTVVREFIVVRPTRMRKISAQNIVERSWQVQDVQLAQNFDVAYYNYEQVEDFLIYPKGGWSEDVQVYQVGANETVTFEAPVDFYATSVKQPTVQDNVPKDYSGPASVYSVSGNDGLPITPSQWIAQGGNLSVAILPPGNVLEVTVTGPDFEELAPYSIGLNDGSSSYSTLRIVGDGMNFDRQIYTEKTGLSSNDVALVSGGEIDNVAIDTLEDAKRFALFARRLYALPTQTFSTSAPEFPRLEGTVTTVLFPTFADFGDTLPAAYSFTNFNADYSGVTFEDFTVQVGNAVPQGFGEVSGARVRLDDAMYRVRNVTITPEAISIDAEYDTLFEDLNDVYVAVTWENLAAAWTGVGDDWSTVLEPDFEQRTFADLNSFFQNTSFKDFALIPMRDKVSVLV